MNLATYNVGCISLVRLWLGHEQSVFVGVLTGVVSYTVATLILSVQHLSQQASRMSPPAQHG